MVERNPVPAGRSFLRAAFAILLLCGCAMQSLTVYAAGSFDRGLLWRIDAQGVAPSYLFGTIHLDDARVTALPGPVRTSLDGASSFTMEVTFDPANLLQLAGRMVYLDGRDLPGVIGEALFKQLVRESASLGIPGDMLRVFRPWAMALLLVMPQQRPADILDNVLFRIATEQRKPVHHLETVDEQIAAFEGLPEADQVVLLRHAVENRARMPQNIARLVDAYLARDLAAMAKLSADNTGVSDDMRRVNASFRKRLLDERHGRMIERMQPQLQQGGAFIAVGALHLHGPEGLLVLLQGRGYRVQPVY